MIAISKLQLGDIKDFVSLWNQEYKLLTSSQLQMTVEKAKSGFISKMFEHYGIYKNRALVGFMLIKETDGDLWIKHMIIDKNSRNEGMGKMLLSVIVKKSLLINKKIKVEVLNSNKLALEFFIKNNFKTIASGKGELVLEFIN